LQAPPEAAEELVREIAQGGVVVVSGRSATVVVRSGAGGLGEHREGTPVACVAETLVADLAGLDVVRAAGGAGDWRGAGKRAQACRRVEPGGIVADLGQDPSCENRSQTGGRAQNRCERVGVEPFAIIGTWQVDEALDSEQLAHIVSNVRQQPGFVRGYWGQEVDDVAFAHAVVLLDDEVSAQRMAEGVKAAIPSAILRVVRVLADV
jgi:hypothetical protein